MWSVPKNQVVEHSSSNRKHAQSVREFLGPKILLIEEEIRRRYGRAARVAGWVFVVFAFLIPASVIILALRLPSWWNILPLTVFPICTLIIVLHVIQDFLQGAAGRRSPFRALSFILVMYFLMVMSYGCSYSAAVELGGQVICDGQCITDLPNFLYFSIVTATTLGYGDLSPTGISKFLSCMEVILFWTFLVLTAVQLKS